MALIKIFGETLRELRLEKGLSQEKLAELCDLTPNYISFLERGLRQPTLTTLYKLSSALNLSINELINSVESKRVGN